MNSNHIANISRDLSTEEEIEWLYTKHDKLNTRIEYLEDDVKKLKKEVHKLKYKGSM